MISDIEKQMQGYPCPKCESGIVKRRLFKSGLNPIYETQCNVCHYDPKYDLELPDSFITKKVNLPEDKLIERYKHMISSLLNSSRFDFTLDQLRRINNILNE